LGWTPLKEKIVKFLNSFSPLGGLNNLFPTSREIFVGKRPQLLNLLKRTRRRRWIFFFFFLKKSLYGYGPFKAKERERER
jgi:hypothetical protein